MAEVHSTYQWELSEPDGIDVRISGRNTSVNVTVTISKNNVFAIIEVLIFSIFQYFDISIYSICKD